MTESMMQEYTNGGGNQVPSGNNYSLKQQVALLTKISRELDTYFARHSLEC